MVVAQHCWLLPFGWTGVWIFFVISGYVISMSLLDEQKFKRSSGVMYRVFVLKRFFRIVPLYLLYICINVAVICAIGNRGALMDLPFLLSFTYNWQMIYQIIPVKDGWSAFGHLWTLSIEEQFYLFYPLIVLFLARGRSLTVMICLLAAGPFIRWLTSYLSGSVSDDAGWIAFSVYASSICQFDAFLAGALLAVFREDIRRNPQIVRRLWIAAIFFATVYVGVYVGIAAMNGATGSELIRRIYSGNLSGQGREVFVYTSVTLIAASIMAAIIARRPFTRPLAWPLLVHVGKVSYGGYLYHALVLLLIERFLAAGPTREWPVWERLVLYAAAWTITVVVATISYRYYESWFLDVSGRMSRRILAGAEKAGPAAEASAGVRP